MWKDVSEKLFFVVLYIIRVNVNIVFWGMSYRFLDNEIERSFIYSVKVKDYIIK